MQRNAPRRQHYVPQWYLRRFRDPTSKAGRDYVAAYDQRSKTQHERMAIKNVAVEADLYTMSAVRAADAYKVEELLARRDELDFHLTERILKQGKVDRDDIPEVKQFIAFQYFRTRWFREMLRSDYRSEQPRLAAELAKAGPPPAWPADQQAEFWQAVEELRRGEWVAPDGEDGLLELQFSVYESFLAGLDLFGGFTVVLLSDAAFVTSDNPIVVRHLETSQWGTVMEIGLAHTVELWVPLSPRHALLLTRSIPRCPMLVNLLIPQVRSINNALMQVSDRWTIWQPGSAADQFLDLPVARKVISQRRSARDRTSADSASPSEN